MESDGKYRTITYNISCIRTQHRHGVQILTVTDFNVNNCNVHTY